MRHPTENANTCSIILVGRDHSGLAKIRRCSPSLCRIRSQKLRLPRRPGPDAPLIVIGGEITVAKAFGNCERYGLVSMLAAPSTCVTMTNIYELAAVSGGNVTEVWAVL